MIDDGGCAVINRRRGPGAGRWQTCFFGKLSSWHGSDDKFSGVGAAYWGKDDKDARPIGRVQIWVSKK